MATWPSHRHYQPACAPAIIIIILLAYIYVIWQTLFDMANPEQRKILDIEDALVTDENPEREVEGLDYERCARLHNYLVAYRWMARTGQDTPDLDAMANERVMSPEQRAGEEERRQHLHPTVNQFLDLIIRGGLTFFYWVAFAEIQLVDDIFFEEENDLEDEGLARFVTIYPTYDGVASDSLGLVYDQQNHLAAVPLDIGSTESLTPIDEHYNLWYPLETILTHWIQLAHMGKVAVALNDGDCSETEAQVGSWVWRSYCPMQVDDTVDAIDRYTAAIEARMPPSSLLPLSRETPLFTNADLDAASVPEECFIRSVLTRIKTPRFKAIAPGLEVPHDTAAFIESQKFTGVPRNHESGQNIPPVLLFPSADKNRTLGFNQQLRYLFFGRKDTIPFTNEDQILTGLYSESVCRANLNVEEAGFRLVLPFVLRSETGTQHARARLSDGSELKQGSFTELFQQGTYQPFGGEHRAQRLERLMERWTELVEEGVWAVGDEGVEGVIDQFRDANESWEDYWISPWW